MKRLLLILGAVVLVVGGLAVPAFAAEEGVVTVTVTVAVVSIMVEPDAISYGLVGLDTEGLKPVEPSVDPRIQAKNTGSSWVEFTIKGADTDNWTLGAVAAPETYVHYFGRGPTGNMTYTALDTDWQNLDGYVSNSPGCASGFGLMMDTPTSSAFYGAQTTAVTVMVTMVAQGNSLTLDADGPYTLGGGPAVLTANVTDNVSAPVTGIPSGNFRTFIPGMPGPQPVTFTEAGSGIYSGNLTISALPSDNYTVRVFAWDTSMNRAVGGANFEITTP